MTTPEPGDLSSITEVSEVASPPMPAVTAVGAAAAAVANPTGPPSPDYPATLEITYPEELGRFMPLIKWLLAIPHFVVLLLLGIGGYFVMVWAFFAVLFTAKYPEGAFRYNAGVLRWGCRVSAYLGLQTDKYPPFSLDDDPEYPIRVAIERPERVARWRPFLQGIMVFPVALAMIGLVIGAYLALPIAFFSILFTKRIPVGVFAYLTVLARWSLRVQSYSRFMVTKYPPFVYA